MGQLIQSQSQQIAVQQHANQYQDMMLLVEKLISSPDVDIERANQVLDFRDRMMSQIAEKEFFEALSQLQSSIPAIPRNGKTVVNGQVRSRYALLDDIMSAVKPLLGLHGFSLTFNDKTSQGAVTVTGVLGHRSGHKISNSLVLPSDGSGSKNAIQSIGSSLTYGRRYVVKSLLNISDGEGDDDGEGVDVGELVADTQMLTAAPDSESLREAFSKLWVKYQGNQADRKRITAAYDARKAELL